MAITFVLTKPLFKSLTGRLGVLKCYACGERFKEGETVVSKSAGRASTKRYHTDCYLSLWK